MKRILPVFLALLLLLTACGAAPETAGTAAETPEPSVSPTEPLPADPSGGAETLPPPDEPGEEPPVPEMGGDPLIPVDGVPILGGGTVTLDGISSYLRVDLPEGWTWAQAGGTVDGTVYGLWPESDPGFKVELHYWPQSFAMCGTGVTFEDYRLPNGEKATLATEEIGEDLMWTLILPESPDSFTIQFSGNKALFEAHRAELELLLGTIRQGVLAGLDVVRPELADG